MDIDKNKIKIGTAIFFSVVVIAVLIVFIVRKYKENYNVSNQLPKPPTSYKPDSNCKKYYDYVINGINNDWKSKLQQSENKNKSLTDKINTLNMLLQKQNLQCNNKLQSQQQTCDNNIIQLQNQLQTCDNNVSQLELCNYNVTQLENNLQIFSNNVYELQNQLRGLRDLLDEKTQTINDYVAEVQVLRSSQQTCQYSLNRKIEEYDQLQRNLIQSNENYAYLNTLYQNCENRRY